MGAGARRLLRLALVGLAALRFFPACLKRAFEPLGICGCEPWMTQAAVFDAETGSSAMIFRLHLKTFHVEA